LENAMPSAVAQIPAAASPEAERHFAARLTFETDCWDVHDSLERGLKDFVLVDVRSPAMYAKSHLPGAVSIPHGKLVASTLAAYPPGTLFVVYCAGPHCNGANRGALRLARLGYPVKELIGGMTGWADEGFAFEGQEAETAVAA
jgi:rhodanese-related sulfurtransferase